jgi:hypothetical protein
VTCRAAVDVVGRLHRVGLSAPSGTIDAHARRAGPLGSCVSRGGIPMGCRGVHFALTEEQASRLMDTPGSNNETLMAFVEDIEGAWGA